MLLTLWTFKGLQGPWCLSSPLAKDGYVKQMGSLEWHWKYPSSLEKYVLTAWTLDACPFQEALLLHNALRRKKSPYIWEKNCSASYNKKVRRPKCVSGNQWCLNDYLSAHSTQCSWSLTSKIWIQATTQTHLENPIWN